MELCAVSCPSCFEVFHIAAPPQNEVPTEVDYDCEVCCRPMRVAFDFADGEVDQDWDEGGIFGDEEDSEDEGDGTSGPRVVATAFGLGE